MLIPGGERTATLESADMQEVVRFLRRHGRPDKVEALVREHRPDGVGRCPICRVHGPCSTYTAALKSRQLYQR